MAPAEDALESGEAEVAHRIGGYGMDHHVSSRVDDAMLYLP